MLARQLSPADFGLVGAAMVVLGLLQLFSEMGFGPAIVQREKLDTRHISTGNTLSLVLGTLLAIFLFLLSEYIAAFFRMRELQPILQVFTIILIFSSLKVVSFGLIQREFKFKYMALIDIVAYFFGYLVVAIPLAILGLGVWALVWGYIVSTFVSMLTVLIIKRHSLKYGFSLIHAKHLLSYGFGFSLAKSANYFAGQGDNIIVGRFLGADALGLYGRAYQLMSLPASLVGSALDKVLFPLMSSVQDDNNRLASLYVRGIGLIFFLSIPLSAFLIITAEPIILALLGNDWFEVVLPFQILTSILVFRMSYKLSDSLAKAKGAVYRRAWRQLVYAVLVFFGAWSGQYSGINGVAIGVSVAVTLNFLLMLQLSNRLIELPIGKILKKFIQALMVSILLAALLVLVVGFMAGNLSSFIQLVIASLTAIMFIAFITFAFRKFLIEELLILEPVLNRFRIYLK